MTEVLSGLNQLRLEAWKGLSVTAWVPDWSIEGEFIDVDDLFRVRVRIENSAEPGGGGGGYGDAVYNNVKLTIKGTELATLLDGTMSGSENAGSPGGKHRAGSI